MRPRTLDQFVGQPHILGPGKLLRRAIEADRITSLIFFGPPGTGKTTLARIIANTTESHFATLNAVLAGVKNIREEIGAAQDRLRLHGQRTILFVDEVHRFNKAQQDALLPHVENGTVVFIGATTENPYFEVNKALVSRSRVFELHTLTEDDLRVVARQALADERRGYGDRDVQIDDDALDHLVNTANGDARSLLNALELAVETTKVGDDGVLRIDVAVAEDSIQRRAVLYDKEGDAHFDTISAFIKSLRGSDPDAALYWLAKMVYAGEDPRFIARRLVILASEDIGNADPRGLTLATSAMQAVEFVGMPEGRILLAQATTYLACAPKSNASYLAVDAALDDVENGRTLPVPKHLQSGPKPDKGTQRYQYAHNGEGHFVDQEYVPTEKIYYKPTDQGYEETIGKRLAYWKSLRKKKM